MKEKVLGVILALHVYSRTGEKYEIKKFSVRVLLNVCVTLYYPYKVDGMEWATIGQERNGIKI